MLVAVATGVGLLSGVYPGIYLTRFEAIGAIRGTSAAPGRWNPRKILVFAQFLVSILLITQTVVVHRQMTYIRNRPLGYDPSQIVHIPVFREGLQSRGPDARLSVRYQEVKEAFLAHPNVLEAAVCGFMPGEIRSTGVGYSKGKTVRAVMQTVDETYLSTMRIDLLEGRNFGRAAGEMPVRPLIVNEAAVRAYGWAEPVGEQITFEGWNFDGEIIGVFGDFHGSRSGVSFGRGLCGTIEACFGNWC